MENKHSPAPWHVVDYAGFLYLQDGPLYTDISLLDKDKCSKAKANALLASKAPEMFAMLKETSKWMEERNVGNMIRRIEIAKLIEEIEGQMENKCHIETDFEKIHGMLHDISFSISKKEYEEANRLATIMDISLHEMIEKEVENGK